MDSELLVNIIQSTKLPYVTVKLYNSNIQALIDTGASVSVINHNFINKYPNIILNDTRQYTLRVANSQIITANKYANFNIEINDVSIPVTALYIENFRFDLLLGMDTLTTAKAELLIANKVAWTSNEINMIECSNDKEFEIELYSMSTISVPSRSGMNIRCKIKSENNLKVGDSLLIEMSDARHRAVVGRQMGVVRPNNTVDVFVTNSENRNTLVLCNILVARATQNFSVCLDQYGFEVSLDDNSAEHRTNRIRTTETDYDVNVNTPPVTSHHPLNPKFRGKAEMTKVILAMEKVHQQDRVTLHTSQSVQINPKLSQTEIQALKRFIDEFEDVFSSELKTTTDKVKHEIQVTDGPVRSRPFSKLSPSERKEIDDFVQRMLDSQQIRPSSSPWSSPVLLVKKKDGTKRFCIDYRKLNAVTKKDVYPLPRIDDALNHLSHMKYFTTLDLISGYYQIPIREEDKEKTAFTTHSGLYEFNVMPFGLTNAPATFQRLMNVTLAGLNWKTCLVYIDDILIFSRTFDEHMSRLREVFDRLRGSNLKVKPSKCRFAYFETNYLGHVISEKGIRPDPDKVKAILNWHEDRIKKDITQVRSFLGICNYYRRFVRNFAQKAHPLTDLLKKNTNITEWSQECSIAFNTLKSCLITQPVMRYPDFTKPFLLQVDASNFGIGAVLAQCDEKGKDHPVAYWSRKLTDSEGKSSATERECLAAVEAIKYFRSYLYGQPFVLETDHKSLEFMDSFKAMNGKVARWKMALADYNFTVRAKPGRKNGNADKIVFCKMRKLSFYCYSNKLSLLTISA